MTTGWWLPCNRSTAAGPNGWLSRKVAGRSGPALRRKSTGSTPRRPTTSSTRSPAATPWPQPSPGPRATVATPSTPSSSASPPRARTFANCSPAGLTSGTWKPGRVEFTSRGASGRLRSRRRLDLPGVDSLGGGDQQHALSVPLGGGQPGEDLAVGEYVDRLALGVEHVNRAVGGRQEPLAGLVGEELAGSDRFDLVFVHSPGQRITPQLLSLEVQPDGLHVACLDRRESADFRLPVAVQIGGLHPGDGTTGDAELRLALALGIEDHQRARDPVLIVHRQQGALALFVGAEQGKPQGLDHRLVRPDALCVQRHTLHADHAEVADNEI